MKNANKTVVKLSALLIGIAIIFGAINAVWYFGYKKTFDEFSKAMEESPAAFESKGRYELKKDDCICQLKMPEYLGSGGYLTVQKAINVIYEIDDNGNIVNKDEKTVILHIWPQKFGGYTYGVSVISGAEVRQININADCSVVPQKNGNTELDEYNTQIISENSYDIMHLFEIAKAVWMLECA